MVGVPDDLDQRVIPQEIENARTAPHRPVTGDADLLRYLPEGYFNAPEARAALERIINVNPTGYADSEGGKRILAGHLLNLYNPTAAGRNGLAQR